MDVTLQFQDHIEIIQIDQSATLQDIYEHLKEQFYLTKPFEEMLFYSKKFNKYYSGKDTRLDQDENELKVSIQNKVNLNRKVKISIKILCGRFVRHFSQEADEFWSYNDLSESILHYMGYGEDVIQVDLYLHDYRIPRNQTLKQLQIKDYEQFTAKVRYTGG